MLFNFCDPRLQPEIQCNTISTEGYEVTNLINDTSKGFLAYSCIKPPVNIDITFLCNIRIHHILIWPSVGSQKSSGFQLYAKSSNDSSMPYALLATGFLNDSDTGVMFYPSNMNDDTLPAPSNFLKRYMRASGQYLSTYTNNLRICICKTQNSVPALSKIEVWGTVSPRCGKDTIASVYLLWSKQESSSPKPVLTNVPSDSDVETQKERSITEVELEIPESFLDAITCEIMTQPMLLPSGKTIDQSTLQKHEESQALWGRGLSDPFTGIPFSTTRKPILATALKTRIDKFLLENSTNEEVKKLPRVLGRAQPETPSENQLMAISRWMPKDNESQKIVCETRTKLCPSSSIQKTKQHCHSLPVVVTCPKRTIGGIIKAVKKPKTGESHSKANKDTEDQDKSESLQLRDLTSDNKVNANLDSVALNLIRFSTRVEVKSTMSTINSCQCCDSDLFYRLPCNDVVCRKVLISMKDNKCSLCGTSYKASEIKRIHK